MIDFLLFVISLIVVIRTLGYGFWTIKNNISGGIFIILIASFTSALAAYLLVFTRT